MKSPGSEMLPEPVGARGATVPEASEPELIARVLRGDAESFQPLVETYEPAVYGLSRRLLGGDAIEAEDLTQETFLRAYRCLGDLKDRNRFGPWLYQIARSLCRDRRRHLAAERRALERRVDIARWEPPANEDDRDVESVLDELPGDERRALELKYFEGLSYREIARAMGLTFARVDHLIRQARGHLVRRIQVREHRERSL